MSRTVLRAIPLALIMIGFIGIFICQYHIERIRKAEVVVGWCRIEILNEHADKACAAVTAAKIPDQITPLVHFYDAHPDYLTELERTEPRR